MCLLKMLLGLTYINFMFFLCFINSVKSDGITSCGYDACTKHKINAINVHIIAHSHCDVGWVKTIDEYYESSVRRIINGVIRALIENPNRRFIQVETAFFKKYWSEIEPDEKREIRELVDQGRLEIVNGAWSMNDEATTHYQSIIDQYTSGLRYMTDALGSCVNPKVGWQIDPFGHSKEFASLLAQFGFDATILGRIDYRERRQKSYSGKLDFMWHGDYKNHGSKADIFTSILYDLYISPYNFKFAYMDHIDEENAHKKLTELLNYVVAYQKGYSTNNIPFPIGSDFDFTLAEYTFSQLDVLINEAKDLHWKHQPVNVFYSTPTCFIKAVHESLMVSKTNLSQKHDDFFPYSDKKDWYWTGYFTSKPSTKRFERLSNNFLQVTKQLAVWSNISYDDEDLGGLREAIGILQHHDAITGTEKEYVQEDYHRILSSALAKANNLSTSIVSTFLEMAPLNSCLLANISYCPETMGSEFTVVVYNPLSRPVTHYVEVPVTNNQWEVIDNYGDDVTTFVSNPIADFEYMLEGQEAAPYILHFAAVTVPPLGFSTFVARSTDEEYFSVPNPFIKGVHGFEKTSIQLDSDGLLESMTINGIKLKVRQQFMYYKDTESGAYAFKPNSDPDTVLQTSSEIENVNIISNSEYCFIYQNISSWLTQIIKIYRKESYIEFDWVVGPLPRGYEVVSRFSTAINNSGLFYTDANGRQMVERVAFGKKDSRDFRPYEKSIAAYYYPITSKISIKDQKKNMQFSVLTDRAQGGTSPNPGEIEIMIHRSTKYDDNYGVEEALNEVQFGKGLVVRGQHWVTFGSTIKNSGRPTAVEMEKDISQRKQFASWVFVSNSTNKDTYQNMFLLKKSLPKNVQLLTLEPWNDNKLLIRFEHIFEKDESFKMSKSVTIDLKYLFTAFEVINVEEMTLAGNNVSSNEEKLRWPGNNQEKITKDEELNEFKVVLNPMQIRTFIVEVQYLEY